MELLQVTEGKINLNKHEKLNISLVDIAKTIKQQLKIDYPLCKFSISTQFYSMGCSLHISIIETNFKLIRDFDDLSEVAIISYLDNGFRTREDLKKYQSTKYHQITKINNYEDYNSNVWNNGVFLSEKGFELVKRITELTNKFNWNYSDSQTDYYDVKFSLNLSIGKWNKDFIDSLD